MAGIERSQVLELEFLNQAVSISGPVNTLVVNNQELTANKIDV